MMLSLSGDVPDYNAWGDQRTTAPPELVELARQGDASAFTALFHLHNAPLCTYLARLLGDDELGRDIAQETFLRAWMGLQNIKGELHFKPWLYRIATNLARSHMRRARLVRWLPWIEHEDLLQGAGPEEGVSEAECIKLALVQIAPQCRACLILQVVGGFSQREIAGMLHISEKSVSSYVSRGREQFRHAYYRAKGAPA